MGVVFEVFAPDGTLQLNTETKPIGRGVKLHSLYHQYSIQEVVPFIDPETGAMIRHHSIEWMPRFKVPDNHLEFLQLNDGAWIRYTWTGISPHTTWLDPGHVLHVDVGEFFPTPQPGEALQVFNERGQMVWGSESLYSSVQLISRVDLHLGDMTYGSIRPLFFDIPEGMDPSKVFYLPIVEDPQTDHPSENMRSCFMRRRGRRIYLMPDGGDYGVNMNSHHAWKRVVDSTTTDPFQVLVIYVPNPPPVTEGNKG